MKAAAACAGAAVAGPVKAAGTSIRVFDVAKYGAVGDGNALDSPAIQRAIDEAAAYAGKAQVLKISGTGMLQGRAREFMKGMTN